MVYRLGQLMTLMINHIGFDESMERYGTLGFWVATN
jgi:hypothetical protein